VDNQHRKIEGYRDLSAEEIALMNSFKADEARILSQITDMQERVKGGTGEAFNTRSLAIAYTNFQQAFMWLIRAVARPNGE
jgi:hypothetical protein